MPMVQVTTPAGALTAQQEADLSERLTHVLLMIEGGNDNPAGRGLAYVIFNDVDPKRWYVGGQLDDSYVSPGGRIIFDITVPEGSCNQQRKTQVHQAVNTAYFETIGIDPNTKRAGNSAWVVIHEVREGHWGAGGRTISIREIAKAAQMNPDRADYYDTLLAARHKLHTEFGYPDHTATY